MEEKRLGGFWSKHGANMVEYLILAAVIASVGFTYSANKEISDLKKSTSYMLRTQTRVIQKQDKQAISISDLKAGSVSRAELQSSVDRIERLLERAVDKMEARNKK